MNSWGLSTSIDLYGCDPIKIRDKDMLYNWVIQLCELIDMKRFGEPTIVHFGHDGKEGYSVIQLIETSCITAHFAEDTNAAYIDVFSCKDYIPETVATFCADYFDADDVICVPLVRE